MKEIHTFGLLSCTDCFRIPNPRNRDCRMVVAGVAISVGSYSVIYPSPLCYGAQPLLVLSRARHAPTKTGCQLAFKQQPPVGEPNLLQQSKSHEHTQGHARTLGSLCASLDPPYPTPSGVSKDPQCVYII